MKNILVKGRQSGEYGHATKVHNHKIGMDYIEVRILDRYEHVHTCTVPSFYYVTRFLMVKVGDLCLMDGYRIVLVIEIERDGISDDVVKVRWKSGEYWVGTQRLALLS